MTSIVDTLHALFAEQPVGPETVVALGWLVGILVAAYAFAVLIYRRKFG